MINKVTFLVSTISNGGAEAVCVNIANGLAERGWQVDLLVLHTKEQAYLERLSTKVNLIDLKANRARYAAPALLWYLLNNKPSILFVFKYELLDLSVLLKKVFFLRNLKIVARNINTLSQKINLSSNINLKEKFIKLFYPHAFFGAKMVINQCQDMQDDLLSLFPELESRCVVIHNPVAKHIEESALVNRNEKSPNSYLLCVGRLTEQKAFHQAIAAFALIANQYPKLRLKFVGQGELQQTLEQQARELGIADRVDFEGFQTDVIPYYRNATLTLLTSNYEGFPNVLIESIVLGTPVVSFDCPSGPREILDYGKYGKLVEPGDIEGLAQAMTSILETPNQFNLAERASFFSVEKAIDKYIDVLEKVI